MFSKYAWVIPLKEKRGITITNDFQKILKESNRKPNKLWVGKGSEFYNNSFKKRMILRCIRYIMKENLLLQKDFLEHWKTRFLNTWKLGHVFGQNVWSEEVFISSTIKNTVPWTYVINDFNGEEITGTFYEKEVQKTNQK